MTAPRPLVVLESFPAPRPTTNPYLVQLLASLPGDVRALTFDWRTALTARYDVLHVHWPENLLRGRNRAKTVARRLCVALLLLRATARRTAVVRTLHNTAPHEGGGRIERAFLRWWDRRTTLWVRLNPGTEPPTAAPVVTILHGHYRDWFAAMPHPEPVPGRILFFGLVRPYKGVEALLDAFAELDGDEVSLRVVGHPTTDELRERVRAAVASDPRVTARLEYVDDAALAEEVGRADLVALPYRALHNSGVALLALSLDRPVLLPRSALAAELDAEVGTGWVATFDDTVGPEDLARALKTARSTDRTPAPDLSARGWAEAGRAHADAFRRAVACVRGRGDA